jgi:hypothetical protein
MSHLVVTIQISLVPNGSAVKPAVIQDLPRGLIPTACFPPDSIELILTVICNTPG